MQTEFTSEYKEVFRLLPAYRVAFDRPDGLRVFIETESSRMGTSVNHARAIFSWLFAQLHTWDFLKFNETFRITFVLFLVVVCMLATITGVMVYIFLWKSIRKQRNLASNRARRLHRTVGIAMSLSLFAFGLSAAFHIFPKYEEEDRSAYHNDHSYLASQLDFSILSSIEQAKDLGAISNLSLAHMNGNTFLQVFVAGKRGASIHYLDVQSKKFLSNGDQVYARYLANKFGNHSQEEIVTVDYITKFKGEYGFVNKRLPVYKVQYNTSGNERIYVETSTGKLGAKIKDKLAVSGFLFAYLHKYHFLDFAGKGFRDTVMSFFAFGNFIVAFLGLTLLLKSKRK